MRNNEERLGIKKSEDTNVINNALSFVIPTEYIDLPSKGRFYPVGHPLRDKHSIEIKQMTAKEEDILTSENYMKKGVTLEKLLESIIMDKNIPVDSICSVDRSAILLAARISAYGPEYKASVNCEKCGQNININYDLINQPQQILAKDDLQITENGTFVIVLPNTGWDLECRLLRGSDENNNMYKDTDSLVSQQLLNIIHSIKGVEDREILKKALEVLPAKDSRFLRNAYKDMIPRLKFGCKVECTKCSSVEEMEVPVTLEFFWPK